MRRSSIVRTPLLATTAMALLTGCANAHCLPTQSQTTCAVQSSKTLFGGFGKGFSENPDTWIFCTAWGALMVWIASKGG